MEKKENARFKLLLVFLGILGGASRVAIFLLCVLLTHLYHNKVVADLTEALEASGEALELQGELLGARCEPVYQVVWPELGCSARLGWPPFECKAEIMIYRHSDLERVRGRMEKAGNKPGMKVLIEKGVKERELEVTWTPKIKGRL